MDENNINQQEFYAKYKPLSPWAYLGYTLLFCIPIVNIIILIIFAFSGENVNKKNYARAYLLISLVSGLLIFSTANNITNDAVTQIDSLTVSMTNNQILRYADDGDIISGHRVIQLINQIEALEEQDVSIDIKGDVKDIDDVDAYSKYEISLEYDSESGIIDTVRIEEN